MSVPSQKEKLQNHLARLAARVAQRIATLERVSRNFSRVRLVFVLLAALTTYLMGQYFSYTSGWLAFLLSAGAFALMVQYHERIERSLIRHRVWHRLKTQHLARMSLDWEKLPKPVHALEPSAHPFSHDLNIEGERGLLQLLDNTTSFGGSVVLRKWLLHPLAAATDINERQAIIRELKPLVRFRDHLTLQGALLRDEKHERWEGEKLLVWLQRKGNVQKLRAWLIGLAALAALNLTLFVLRVNELAPLLWPYTLMAYAYAYVFRFGDLGKLFDEACEVETRLRPFQIVAQYLEQHRFTGHAHLMRLCAPFRLNGRRPSELVQQATRVAEAASMQRGQIFWVVLNLLMPWDFYFWYRLEKIKNELRASLPRWLEAWYELESYNALAHFAYLHPDYVFPQLQNEATPPLVQACNLGHPLLPDHARVSNDIFINHSGEIVLITGSNMSGKSTFLRAVGVNLMLTYCGAPVCATQLCAAPMRLFTCMAVSDSVADGISFFYAEVKRLKALLLALQSDKNVPLFFLVDEIFRGTNNRERLLGSRAYIRGLAQSNGCGMISTHDLELVELAHEIPALRNYHFREQVEEGRMVFDYLLREGPCPTTNALKIMALEGLPVA